jgi:hypothetical protein
MQLKTQEIKWIDGWGKEKREGILELKVCADMTHIQCLSTKVTTSTQHCNKN